MAIALAGFAPQGNLGIFLLFAGVVLICCPPLALVGLRWWAGGIVLVGCCALSLLPARWLSAGVPWRQAVATLSVIPMPETISPSPLTTVFWLSILALTVVLGLFVLSQPIRSGSLVYLVLLAVLICGVYAALSIGAKLAGWRPPLVSEPAFGFFPNRNHTATFLVTGSILALSLLNVALLARRWIIVDLAIASLVPCLVGLFCFSGSRAGVVFLVLGATLWVTGFWAKHRDRRLFLWQGTIAVVALGCLLAFQSTARDRLLASVGFRPPARVSPTPAPVALIPDKVPVEQGSELRLPIWRDTLHMIGDAPLTGTGLGTFSWVFPQYRQFSLTGVHAVHPESDWLLFIAEAGWPAFLCVVVLGLGLAGRLAAGRGHPYWPLRWGCATAALTALLHGAVDVPAHRAALGWWVLVLAGWSLSLIKIDPATDTFQRRRSRWRWQRVVFALAGVSAITLGVMLIAAEWFGGPDLPPFLVEQAPFKIFELNQHKNFQAAETLARRVIKMSPLFDQPYFHLGVTLASESDERSTDAKVDDLFRAQRLLDPDAPSVPLLQANTWVGYDPVRQVAMDFDVLARQARIDRQIGVGSQHTINDFGGFVSQARDQPGVQRLLLDATRPDVRFGRAWLADVPPEVARAQADNVASDDALLRGLSEADRQLVRPDWYLQRERSERRSLLPDGLGSARQGWPVRLRQMVNAGQFKQAVDELSRHDGISLELPPTQDRITVPGVSEETAAAIRQGNLNHDFAKARRLLKQTVVVASDPASSELLRWQAAYAAHDGDWSEAWLSLESYVHATRPEEWP